MKKYFTLIILVPSCFNISSAQNNFYKSFNFYGVYDIIQTYDGGFACVSINEDIFIIDSNTHLKFHRKLYSDTTFIFNKIIQTTDSGFVVSTALNPFNNNGLGCVIKFDKNGNYLWSKKYYHSLSSSSIKDMIISENNGFYLLASGCIGGPVLIKCNETGDIIWQKKSDYGTSSEKIIKYSDDKLLLFGSKLIDSTLI